MFLIDGLGAVMRSALHWYMGFSGPLVALALLSFTVFVVMLPLYAFGDKLLARHKRHLARLRPDLDSISGISGAKKYFYTREIYRLYGYSPLHSLLGLFGLLVQLPFFLAAYRMLHDFGDFSGLNAGPFVDLSQPDTLLHFSGLQIHLAPLIMTLLNLLSAYYYAESKDEKKKIWLFPLLFLVLLYKQPSALVFYWAMNNVFSLAKNLWQRRRKSRKLGGAWYAIEELKLRNILRSCFSKKGHALHFALFCAAILFGMLYFLYTDSDKEIPSLWANFSILMLFYLSGFYLLHAFQERQSFVLKQRVLFGLSLAFWLLNIVLLVFLLVLELRSSAAQELAQLVALRQQVQFLRPFLLLCGLLSSVCALICRPYASAGADAYTLGIRDFSRKPRFGLALFLCLLAVLVTVPLRVLASDPASFIENGGSYAQLAVLLLVLGLWIPLYGLYRILPKSLQHYLCFFAVLGACFFSINVLLLPGNYGSMEFTSFKQPLQISHNAIAGSALLLVILLVGLLLQKGNPKLDSLLWLLLVLHGAFIGQSTLRVATQQLAGGSSSSSSFSAAEAQISEAQAEQEKQHKNQIFFSRSQPNVIIVMLDKFIGGMLPEILRANPALAERLSGFTYYPNAVSQAHLTYGGFHPIVGGSEYTVDKINSSKQDVASSIIEAFTMIPKALQPKGFRSYFLNVKYLLAPRARGAMEQSLSEAGVEELESSLDYSLLPDPSAARSGSPKWQNFFVLLGGFQALGPIFRDKIYDDGRWLGLLGDKGMWAAIAFWEPYIELLGLSNLVQVAEEQETEHGKAGDVQAQHVEAESGKPVYLLIHNHFPHNTRFAGAEQYYANPANFTFALPKIPEVVTREDAQNGNRKLELLFLADYQSLMLVADWFDDLKAKGLYDNTQIFLVSDHGARVFDPSFREQRKVGFPFKGSFHSLYMSKERNAPEERPLQSSDIFHTMADVPSELLPELGVQQNPHTGQKLEPVHTEPLPLYIVAGVAQSEELAGNDYQIYTLSEYKLHNRNIFEPENWEGVSSDK